MTTTSAITTADELWRMADDGQRHELIRGELTMMAPAGGGHGEAAMTIGALLTVHVKQRSLGTAVAAETGFILSRNPDTVRAPDAAFIRRARVPAQGLPAGYIPFAPDIAVEVLSPSDTQIEVEEKVEQWLAAGTALVWVVNPRSKTVTVHRAGRDPRVLRENATLEGEDVCPGFAVKVADVFA